MKCPKDNKNCKISVFLPDRDKGFICVGENKKPHFKCDKVKLCLKNKINEIGIEITPQEALMIAWNLIGGMVNYVGKTEIKENSKHKK